MKTFNRKISIALNLMQYLFLAGGDVVSCDEMAMALHESKQHCDQVLWMLKQRGYVSAFRGIRGGYSLNASAPLISVSQFLDDFGKGFATHLGLERSLASERLSATLEHYTDYLTLEEIFVGEIAIMEQTHDATRSN